MSIPNFTELGQSIREVLQSGYQYGHRIIKVTLKTKSGQDLELGSSYNLNCNNPTVDGNATAKLRLQDYGILSEKWYSNGTINLEYEIDGKPFKGLGLASVYSYNPSTHASNIKLITKFKNEITNISCSVSNTLDKNFHLFAGAVVGLNDFFVGYQFGYDTSIHTFTKSDVGLIYKLPSTGFQIKFSPGITRDYDLSAIHRVNDNLRMAISGTLIRSDNGNDWTYGCGLQYKLDQTSTLRMKLNREMELDTSIQQLVYEGIKLTLAFSFDLTNVIKASHRIGLAFDIEV